MGATFYFSQIVFGRSLTIESPLNADISDIRGKQLPVSLGDDFDGVVGHFDGGVIVNRI